MLYWLGTHLQSYFGPLRLSVFPGEAPLVMRVLMREYQHGRTLACQLYLDATCDGPHGMPGEPWCTLSVCMPDVLLQDDELIARISDENAETSRALIEAGLFEQVSLVPLGYAQAAIWRLTPKFFELLT